MEPAADINSLHLVIDTGADMRQLHHQLNGLGWNTALVPATAGLSGLASVIEQRSAASSFDAISLYCHASSGRIDLGQQTINADNVSRLQRSLKHVAEHIKPGGDLLLYGCNLASKAKGQHLIDRLSAVMGVDIAASTDLTGQGGNWRLEYQHGHINAEPVDQLTGLNWAGRLAETKQPIQVPLHWLHENQSRAMPKKLGIYATLGNSKEPQVFELDTGGAGFYATYGTPKQTPWWGKNWSPLNKTFHHSFDSGLHYKGQAVTTTVNLFSDANSKESLLSADNIVIGQTTTISNTKTNPKTQLWPLIRKNQRPPVNGAFYGDFGLALKKGKDDIESLAAQMSYGTGLIPGFRIHASATNPWIQFGLKDDEAKAQFNSISLTKSGKSSSTGIPFYETPASTGTLSIKKRPGTMQNIKPFSSSIGLIFDTGASTTLHTTKKNTIPADLTQAGKRIISNLDVTVSSPSAGPSTKGQPVTLLKLITGTQYDRNLISIEKSDSTYLNTGILPFLEHDVIFNLKDGFITLLPQHQLPPQHQC